MKKLKTLIAAFLLVMVAQVNAQTADEVINNYFENIGGVENLQKLDGIKINASLSQGGMEIPITIYQLKDGRQASIITFQGKEMKQGVYDGENLWSTNFQTQKAERMDAETTANSKLDANDFPDSFLDYKEKGYTVEMMGKEDFKGTEVFKVKLVKEPMTVDGKPEESVSYYLFDTENYVPLAMQTEIKSGPAKGMVSEVTFSDYQEVDGLYFPFSMTQGVKDGQSAPITIKSIELNPTVEDTVFIYPSDEGSSEKDKN
ncbi:outer membrane lipoprotein-sorting protein [Flavobacteriaceae bacterium MAR_2010_188]|nr:outer membrane lipoprotein-sorting protein [Flavobacteriaceae bacterium MAR_2010_188]